MLGRNSKIRKSPRCGVFGEVVRDKEGKREHYRHIEREVQKRVLYRNREAAAARSERFPHARELYERPFERFDAVHDTGRLLEREQNSREVYADVEYEEA